MKNDLKTLCATFLVSLLCVLLPLSNSEAKEKRPLFFYIFMHEDIPAAERTNIRADYFSWMIKDLESFTGRRVYLEIIENHPTLKGFSYKTLDLNKGHEEWTRFVDRYMEEKNLPRNQTSKYLLLTRHKINADTYGYTSIGYYTAVASIQTYTAAAHEIGHMLGGDHEHSEILFRNGWWCETNITPSREPIRANCYIYSDKNKQVITRHLDNYP
ncbi:hypothetical protein [Pseudomonas cichorii]|nr:hypothetical protein [Pseudomonas cichorii]